MTNSPFHQENWIPSFCHELQNPATVILGMIGIVLSEYHGPVSDQQRADLTMIQAQTLFISRIAKEMSCFSKISQSDFKLKKDTHSVQELAEYVVRAHQKNVDIKMESSVDSIIIDVELVAFALSTLVTNAVLVSGDILVQMNIRREIRN